MLLFILFGATIRVFVFGKHTIKKRIAMTFDHLTNSCDLNDICPQSNGHLYNSLKSDLFLNSETDSPQSG